MLFALLLAQASVNLDAPMEQRPTVRTEINRGYEAAFTCVINSGVSASGLYKCVENSVSHNKQAVANPTAFMIGAYLQACENLAGIIQSQQPLAETNPIARAQLSDATVYLGVTYRRFRNEQQNLGVSDNQIVESIRDLSANGKQVVLAKLQIWRQSPPPAP